MVVGGRLTRQAGWWVSDTTISGGRGSCRYWRLTRVVVQIALARLRKYGAGGVQVLWLPGGARAQSVVCARSQSLKTCDQNEAGWLAGWMDGWMAEWLNDWMDGWIDGWMDRWMDGWMDAWMDGRMD